jgi:hypothetical protein
MKRSNSIQRCLLIDPLALAVACIISLLFANATQQYFNTAKRNSTDVRNQTVVCFQISEDPSPVDRPDAWWINKINSFQKQKKNSDLLAVTFDIHQDYGTRLSGYFYGLSQPLVWLPSIPIAHRKLII